MPPRFSLAAQRVMIALTAVFATAGVMPPVAVAAPGATPPPRVDAQELDGKFVHNVNSVLMNVTNFGLIGSLPGTQARYSDAPSAQWPAGSGVEYLFAAGLWVGAVKNDTHLVSGIVQTPGHVGFEFRPGNAEVDRMYRTRELATNGSRPPANDADDDHDGQIDEDPLDGRDNDGDGRVDEDFAAISDQMFSCVYADDDPRIALALPDHRPLGIVVRQSSFAWEGETARNCIGFDFQIRNRSIEVLEDVYVGFLADFNIGPRDADASGADDRTGYWEGTRTLRTGSGERKVHVEVEYMYDGDGDAGRAPGYVGFVFLGSQESLDESVNRPMHVRNCRFFLGTANFSTGGDPTDDDERYQVMEGTAPRSMPPPEPDVVRHAVISNTEGDSRVAVSAGPFASLPPGETLQFQAALVFGAGLDALLDNVARVQLLHNGGWEDCDHNRQTGVNGHETAICGPERRGRFEFNSCRTCLPFDHTCFGTVPDNGCLFVNQDCRDEASGVMTGVDGKECWIPWQAQSPPPPPHFRSVAYEDRVELYWDDRSETALDPVGQIADFESYRVWRADGWTRPPGTNEEIGPPAESWSMLAEYDLADNVVGSNTGLAPIDYQPHVSDLAVRFYRDWFATHPHEPPPDLPGYTSADLDTAQALARGQHYHCFVDPPFLPNTTATAPCPGNRRCPPLLVNGVLRAARCDDTGVCRPTKPGPKSGMHEFYAVTCTDHIFDPHTHQVSGPGLAGLPNGNFVYVVPPSTALPPERAVEASQEIYAVPNPATPQSLAAWQLAPNNDDPTGVKIEFHHLPRALGKVTVWTLAGDRVREMPFDGRNGNGSLAWNLVSRNGQDVTSGLYLFTVECDMPGFARFVGKLVIVR